MMTKTQEAARDATDSGVVVHLALEERKRKSDTIPEVASSDFARLRRYANEVFNELSHANQRVIAEEAGRFSTAKERNHLPDTQVIALIVAWLQHSGGEHTTYSDLLAFSTRFLTKPLSERTIFSTFAELEGLGLLARVTAQRTEGRVGRPRELFAITNFGVISLNLAITFAKHLHDCRMAKEAA